VKAEVLQTRSFCTARPRSEDCSQLHWDCPSLTTKRVHPHALRHTCALTFLQATKDLRKVALWLGHAKTQTTEMYTRVDPAVKLEALESVVPPKLRSGRFKASDKLIAWLEAATFMPTKKQSE
jgi:integrase/recombinase XerD